MRATPSDALLDIADKVVAIVADQASAAEANVLVSRTRHGLTRFANSFIHQYVGEDTVSVLLTLAADGRTSTASTTNVAHDNLASVVSRAFASASLQPVDQHWPGATPLIEVHGSDNFDAATALAEPSARTNKVKQFLDAAPNLSAAGYVDTEATWAAFASTAGQRAQGCTTRATIDGIHQTSTSAGSAHQTSRRLDELDADAAGALAADRAHRSANPIELGRGTFEVVLAPEAVASMLLFLSVYGFNAKSHLEGASFAQLGEQQFDERVTLTEAPSDSRSIGLAFDAQGVPRQDYVLVERGVTRALAHDRRTAKQVGTRSTGNAMPGGESFGAIPMNVVMAPADVSPSELISSCKRGIYITQFHYCRVLDPKSQIVTGLTRNGTFLIEDGALGQGLGNLRFTQSFLEALGPGNVAAVGNDDRYADTEFGPGMVICPSARLNKFRFTGDAQG